MQTSCWDMQLMDAASECAAYINSSMTSVRTDAYFEKVSAMHLNAQLMCPKQSTFNIII